MTTVTHKKGGFGKQAMIILCSIVSLSLFSQRNSFNYQLYTIDNQVGSSNFIQDYNRLVYTNSSGDIIEYNYIQNNWQKTTLINNWIKPAYNSSIESSFDKIFFIGKDYEIHALWKNPVNQTWQNILLNSTSDPQVDSDLFLYNQNLYYHDATYNIRRLSYDAINNSWNLDNTFILTSIKNSYIKVYNDVIYYINSTQEFSNYNLLTNVGNSIAKSPSTTPLVSKEAFVLYNNLPTFINTKNNIVTIDKSIGVVVKEDSDGAITAQYPCIDKLNESLLSIASNTMCIYQPFTHWQGNTYFPEFSVSNVKCIKANQITKNIFILSGQTLLVASNPNYSNQYAGFYLEGNILKQDNIPFYPVGCNYNLKFISSDTENILMGYFASSQQYGRPLERFADTTSAYAEVYKDFLNMKNLGINTIRITIGLTFEPSNSQNYKLTFPCYPNHNNGTITEHSISSAVSQVFADRISDIVNIANDLDLKLILYVGGKFDSTAINDYALLLSDYLGILNKNPFQNETVISLEFYNDVNLNSHLWQYSKHAKLSLYREIIQSLRSVNNNVLLGISTYGGYSLAFEPNLGCAGFDYYSLHTYPYRNTTANIGFYEFNLSWNDLHFVSQVCEIPFMTGESGYSASDDPQIADWGEPVDQLDYFTQSKYTNFEKGFWGFLWWQYSDVNWFNPSHPAYKDQFHGIYSLDETPKILATANWSKPNVNSYSLMPPYYYNFYDLNEIYTYTIRLSDANNNPIQNAVLKVQIPNTQLNQYYISNDIGEITLSSSAPSLHATISSIDSKVATKQINSGENNITLDDFECYPSESMNKIDSVLSIGSDTEHEHSITFNNPILNELIVRGLKVGERIVISDMNGTTLVDKTCVEETCVIGFSQYSSGVYIMIIGNERYKVVKFM